MSSWDFVLKNIRFSYSSTSSFGTCAYGYKLSYLDSSPKENNFFSDYGTFVHTCFEKFFKGEVDEFDLSEYYKNNYDLVVKNPAPPQLRGFAEKRKAQGQAFFDSFSFNKKVYDVLLIEDKIDFDIGDIMVTARPDLVLKEKSTGRTGLFDYKTSTPYKIDGRNGKETVDKAKVEGYNKQMLLYTYAIKNHRNIPIDFITLWYPILNKQVEIPWSLEKENETVEEFRQTVSNIRNEEDFNYNNSSPFFCNNLCGVRSFCEYR